MKDQKKDYSELFGYLDHFEQSIQMMDNARILISLDSASTISSEIRKRINDNLDLFFVAEIKPKQGNAGWISTEVIEWLNNNFK